MVKCDFDVTIGFPNFENFGIEVESEYDIRKIFGLGVEFVRAGVESESEIRDSAHLWSLDITIRLRSDTKSQSGSDPIRPKKVKTRIQIHAHLWNGPRICSDPCRAISAKLHCHHAATLLVDLRCNQTNLSQVLFTLAVFAEACNEFAVPISA